MASTDNNVGDPVAITVQPATPSIQPGTHQNNNLTAASTTLPVPVTSEPKRRVSIASDPVAVGHDNLAFEPNPRRKISQASDHSEVGPVRRKSILHNSPLDNESLHSHQSFHGN